jgi:uncharacterized protein YggE
MNLSTLQKMLAGGVAAAALVATSVAAPLFPATPALAQESPALPTLNRTITVVGEGKISLPPDLARINVGVEVVNASAVDATAATTEQINVLIAALTEAGIAPEDIQTSSFSVYAERFNADGTPSQTVNYRVSNTVSVLVRDVSTLGAILDTAVRAGANNIYGVDFLLDDPSEARSGARAMAMENAKATAEELAGLAGLKIGRVISISEVIGSQGGYYSNQFTAMSIGKGGGDVPVAPGRLELNLELQVVYELVD